MFPKVCSWSSLSSTSTGRASFERNSLDKGSSSSAPPQRHSTVTNALNIDVGQLLHQEMIAGGVLHVSVAQAHSCMERFEDLDSLAAPALPAFDTFLAAANSQLYSSSSNHGNSTAPAASQVFNRLGSTGERLLEEALCLATAPENPTEDSAPIELPRLDRRPRVVSTSLTSNNSTLGHPAPAALRVNAPTPAHVPTNSSSTDEAEAIQQLEYAACQHCTAEAVGEQMPRTSQVLARMRRRRILRLLRDTRETRDSLVATLKGSSAAQMLAQLSSTFANLTTLDGVDVEVCDPDGCVTVWSGAAAAGSEAGGEGQGVSAAAAAATTAAAAAATTAAAAAATAAAAGRVDNELAAWLSEVSVSPECDHDCMACMRFPHGMCAYAP